MNCVKNNLKKDHDRKYLWLDRFTDVMKQGFKIFPAENSSNQENFCSFVLLFLLIDRNVVGHSYHEKKTIFGIFYFCQH